MKESDVRETVLRCLAGVLVALIGAPAPVHAIGVHAATPIELRVQTPRYQLDASGLRVPGYAAHNLPGAPALPVSGTWVELPPSGDWSLRIESVGERILPAPARLAAVAVPQLDLRGPQPWTAQVSQLAGVSAVNQPNLAIYGVDAFYPASPVQVGEVQWQRGRRLLPVRVFPFQYNPVRGEVRHHPDLRVSIDVAESATRRDDPGAKPALVAQRGQAELCSTCGALRVYTGARGLYRLTHDELQAAGVPLATLDPASLAMTYLGEPVDILVTGAADGRFDPGDLVIFYAEPYQGRYMTRNVYRLAYGGAAGNRVQTRSTPPTGAEPRIIAITQTLHIEFDRSYYSTYDDLPSDADHWFDSPLYANSNAPTVAVTYDLALDDPLFSGSAIVRAALHGGADQRATPDQSVAIQVNGQAAGIFQWEGSVPYLATSVFPAAWLDTGLSASQVTLQAALDQLPGIGYYWVSPDWVQVSYPARPDAEEDQIVVEGFAVAGQQAQIDVTGFSSYDVRAFDVRNPRRPVLLDQVFAEFTGEDFTARLWDTWPINAAPPSYALSTDAGLHAPLAVQVDTASAWRTPDHEADYIAIVHRSLWDAVQPLLDHRVAEGLRVVKVDVQDIYDEFSGGRVDPEAIRSFLRYAYHNWNGGQEPPVYVLLVGDGHYDFKNAAGANLPNLIPPYLLPIDPWIGETAADNRYVSVDGPGDYLPDMHIGRIPAQSSADVTAVVQKIIAYETTALAGEWQSRAVFVADSATDPDGNFHALSDAVRLTALPAGIDGQAVYYGMDAQHDSGPEMRAAIQEAFNQGALYLQWFGHASPFRWGSVSMYDILAPRDLQPNQRLPFSVHYGCWSGYFIGIQGSALYGRNPQSLGEVLLLTPGRGSVADLSPSGLHVGSALSALDRGVTEAIFQARVARVGAAVDAGKAYFVANSSAWHDVVDTSIFFGDPALKLRLPARSMSVFLPLVAGDGR